MLPTLALTFDQDQFANCGVNTYSVAFPMMNPLHLVGTINIRPSLIGTPGYYTLAQLVILKMIGWEIGVYLPGDMPAQWTADRDAVFALIKSNGDALQTLGFAPATIAPGGRLWNQYLGNMARGRFKGVRIPQGYVWPQPYPITDPMSGVSGGGAASWGVNDTAVSILARVDSLIAAGPGNMATEVIHYITDQSATTPLHPTPDAYTVQDTVASAVFAGIAQRRDAGLLRVTTFEQALTSG